MSYANFANLHVVLLYLFYVCLLNTDSNTQSSTPSSSKVGSINVPSSVTSNNILKQYQLSDFELVKVLGKGTYGKVSYQ